MSGSQFPLLLLRIIFFLNIQSRAGATELLLLLQISPQIHFISSILILQLAPSSSSNFSISPSSSRLMPPQIFCYPVPSQGQVLFFHWSLFIYRVAEPAVLLQLPVHHPPEEVDKRRRDQRILFFLAASLSFTNPLPSPCRCSKALYRTPTPCFPLVLVRRCSPASSPSPPSCSTSTELP